MIRQSVLLSFLLTTGVAFAQAGSPTITPVPGAPSIPNNGGAAANPGITPAPQPVTPNAGAGSSTNPSNPSRRVSRRQSRAANARQTTVNQTGTSLDQTAARRQGDMTEQRRAGTVDNTGSNDHP